MSLFSSEPSALFGHELLAGCGRDAATTSKSTANRAVDKLKVPVPRMAVPITAEQAHRGDGSAAAPLEAEVVTCVPGGSSPSSVAFEFSDAPSVEPLVVDVQDASVSSSSSASSSVSADESRPTDSIVPPGFVRPPVEGDVAAASALFVSLTVAAKPQEPWADGTGEYKHTPPSAHEYRGAPPAHSRPPMPLPTRQMVGAGAPPMGGGGVPLPSKTKAAALGTSSPFVAAVLEELLARPQGTFVYRVQFKRAFGHFVPVPASRDAQEPMGVGSSVLVRVDRGEDVGIVVDKMPLAVFAERSAELGCGAPGQPCLPGVGTLLRHATEAERVALIEKARDELEVLAVCHAQMRQRRLPMRIVDAEWRFDRQKLTVFYHADRYIDFRGLVRDLFAVYRTRIWMEKLGPLTS